MTQASWVKSAFPSLRALVVGSFFFGVAMSKTDGSSHAFTVSCSHRRERKSERGRQRTMHPFEMKRPMPYRDDRGGEWLEETDVLLRPTSGRGAQVLHYTQGGGTEGRAAGWRRRCQVPDPDDGVTPLAREEEEVSTLSENRERHSEGERVLALTRWCTTLYSLMDRADSLMHACNE